MLSLVTTGIKDFNIEACMMGLYMEIVTDMFDDRSHIELENPLWNIESYKCKLAGGGVYRWAQLSNHVGNQGM